MGAYFGAIAVKTDKVEQVLEVANEYYDQHDLSLVEVSVGDKESQYTKEKVKDILEFQHLYRPKKEGKDIESSTDFDVHFNLKENSGWVVFSYNRRAAKKTLGNDEELAILISKRLFTEVVEYYRYDVVNLLEIRKYQEGKLLDKLITSDLQIEIAEGYFEQYKGKKYESAPNFQEEIEFPYLEKEELNFEAEELDMYYLDHWRRFYLKGEAENIQKYLSRFNVTFENIKSLFNLMTSFQKSLQTYKVETSRLKDFTLKQWEDYLKTSQTEDQLKAYVVARHIIKNIDPKNKFAFQALIKAWEGYGNVQVIDPQPYTSKAVEYFPEESWSHEALAMYYFWQGEENYLKSRKQFEKGLEIDPDNKKFHRMLGEIYLINREPDKAIVYLKKAWDLDPENTEYMTRYAISLVRQQRIQEATELVEQALKKDRLDEYVYDNIGMVYILLGELDRAEKYFKRACEILPKYSYFQSHVEWIEKEKQDKNNRLALGKWYTPLYIRQKNIKRFFDGDKIVTN